MTIHGGILGNIVLVPWQSQPQPELGLSLSIAMSEPESDWCARNSEFVAVMSYKRSQSTKKKKSTKNVNIVTVTVGP